MNLFIFSSFIILLLSSLSNVSVSDEFEELLSFFFLSSFVFLFFSFFDFFIFESDSDSESEEYDSFFDSFFLDFLLY